MTLVGKIFTVLIFFMSCVFMTFSVVVYATHTNWRTEAQDTQKQLTAKEQNVEQLKAERVRLQDLLAVEQAARQSAIAAARSAELLKSDELRTQKAQLNELNAAHGKLQEQNRIAALQLKDATDKVVQLEADIKRAREDRDELYKLAVTLTDDVNGLSSDRRALEERNKQLVGTLAQYTAVMRMHDIKPTDNPHRQAPSVDGVVVRVGDQDLIEISIGSDDGLKEGHTLEVFREDRYLGRVVVRRTTPNHSVVYILPEFKKGLIKKGDRVATKLS